MTTGPLGEKEEAGSRLGSASEGGCCKVEFILHLKYVYFIPTHTHTHSPVFSMGPIETLQNFLDCFSQIFGPLLIGFASIKSRL